jgi:magnesium transporter
MRFIRFLERLLNDGVMGFLAVLGFGAAMAPFAFDIGPSVGKALNAIEVTVLAAFIVDLTVGFIVAPDRGRWLRSPWRIIDFVCILGGIASMLPAVSGAAGSSVALRLLRIGRIIAFGTMVGTTVSDDDPASVAGEATAGPRVRVYGPGGTIIAGGASWNEVMDWLPSPGDRWIDVTNATLDQLEATASRLGLPQQLLRTVLDSRAGSRLVAWEGGVAVSVWLPAGIAEGFPEIRREQLVVFIPSAGIVTATLSTFELPPSLVGVSEACPYGTPTLRRLFDYGAGLHAAALGRLDDELRLLEQTGLAGGDAAFLSRVFRLRREISAAAAELGRYAALVRTIGERPNGGGADVGKVLEDLDELTGRFGELKENLQSLMDLHLNVKSFQMNQFMRFLAVVSFLGLIPSIAGGLLGMNVEGSPWSITLPQVAFIVSLAIAFSLYLFAVRGWLR